MVGIGETYLPAFVLAMGLGQTASGLIVTIPLLAGAVIQLISPLAVTAIGSHKKWVVGCALVQACVFLGLAIAAIAGTIGTTAAFLLASIYWACGMAGGSAWNTWITTLIPERIRTRFFSTRGRWIQGSTMMAFIVAGLALKVAQDSDAKATTNATDLAANHLLTTFAVLFVIAFAARIASAAMLAQKSEPVPLPPHQRQVSMAQLFMRLRRSSDGKLILYLVCAQAATQVAAPFFTPFMLRQMNLDYGTYTALVATAFMGRVLFLPLLGRQVEKYGANKLLLACGVAMAPMAVLWVVAYDNLPALFFLQVLSGVVWGGFELASSLLIYERVIPAERTSILTTYNLSHASALVIGSLVGGVVLEAMGESFQGYLVIFALSSILRTLTITLLLPAAQHGVHAEVRPLRGTRVPRLPRAARESALREHGTPAAPEPKSWPHRDAG
jgi:MFS family permease